MTKVLVKCIYDKRLRMRIISPGYYNYLNCQCAREIRIKDKIYEIESSEITLNTSRGKWFYIFSSDPQLLEDKFDKELFKNIKIYDSGDEYCIICLENQKNKILVPCGHYILCNKCANKVDKCPLCRTHITNKINPSDI